MESTKGMLQTEGRAHTLGKEKILEDRKSLWSCTRMGDPNVPVSNEKETSTC